MVQTGCLSKKMHEVFSVIFCVCMHQLDDNEGAWRRPPARLESLKVKKAQKLHTREEFEEKIRLAEKRRKVPCLHDHFPQHLSSVMSFGLFCFLPEFSLKKNLALSTLFQLKEDKLKMRLRSKSARVRVPAIISSTEKDKDMSITPVETLAAPHPSQVMREAAEGGEWVREDGDGKRECEEEAKKAGKRERREEGGDHRGEGAEREVESREKEEEEEMTQVQEFTASGELECDSSFQHADDKEEVF